MKNRKENLKKYNNKPNVKERVKKWHQENIERVREIKRAYKERNPDADKVYKKNNRGRVTELNRARVKRLRMEMIEAYGGKCSCCGEDTYEFLTLEHKNNNGAAHRKHRGTNTIILELKNLGWPKDDYTILCWNCNSSKFMYGICPHQLKE